MKCLTYKIIIPTKARPDEITEEVVRRTRKLFGREFGGYTSYKGFGGWVDDDGILFEEPVLIVEANYTGDTTLRKDRVLLEFAEYVRDELKQDCVYVSIGDDVFFV